jgi:hypothetical protein
MNDALPAADKAPSKFRLVTVEVRRQPRPPPPGPWALSAIRKEKFQRWHRAQWHASSAPGRGMLASSESELGPGWLLAADSAATARPSHTAGAPVWHEPETAPAVHPPYY